MMTRGARDLRVGLFGLFGLVVASCASQREGVTPLMVASKEGNFAQTRKLLAEGAEVDQRSRYGWTALMFAARAGQQKEVLTLLDAGADPTLRSDAVPSAMFATRGGHPPTTALREAVAAEHLGIARLLLKRGAPIDEETITSAGKLGDVAFLAELQRRGSATTHTHSNGGFLEAARHGKLAAVRWYVSQGSDVNEIRSGRTALSEAVWGDQADTVQYLLSVGAKPDLKVVRAGDGSDETALFTAVSKHTETPRFAANDRVVNHLLNHGANPNTKCWGGTISPLERLEKSISSSTAQLAALEDERIKQRVKGHLEHRIRLLHRLRE